MIEHDSFTLPLCSPCRGIYVLDHELLEVDLWVKKEGGGSNDKQLLSAYVEFDKHSIFDNILSGRIPNDRCLLDMDYMFLRRSVEAVIQVSAEADSPHHVRFTAFSSGFDHEIVMFNDKFCKMGKLFQHVVAVKSKDKLVVCLELEESMFRWTFQDGAVGAVSSPDDVVLKLFHVRVFFAPKVLKCPPHPRYMDWEEKHRKK